MTPSLGAYLAVSPSDLGAIERFEQLTGARSPIVSFYWSWGLGASPGPAGAAREVVAAGRIPLVTWEPWTLPPPGADPAEWPGNREYRLRNIAAGRFDSLIDQCARELALVPGPVWIRPMHEMNGNWYPWCGTTNGNRPADYVRAWRHLRDRFAAAAAGHVRWIWCPYGLSVPARRANDLRRYYPGDDAVDLLGIDGYNWGATRPWSRWQGFAEIFEPAYRTLCDLSDRPIVVAEIGCAEEGGNKAEWLADACDEVTTRFSRVSGVIWFNVDQECDWRVESSPASLAAFRSAWARVSRLPPATCV